MPSSSHFRRALKNIARFGDTDVFPFPFENKVFLEHLDESETLLCEVDANFADWLAQYPPFNETTLVSVGYTGFRSATQLDPLWNAFLLGAVISIADRVEASRLPITKSIVFSYRFKWDKKEDSVFRRDHSWSAYQRQCVANAREGKWVLVTDIAAFYPRVYHHRIENALKKAAPGARAIGFIMTLLDRISKNVSYGLPVGGPAARLLSELLLNRVDRLLVTNGFRFCRYADDYHLFTDSREDAYRALVFLSAKLQENEGLSLQKSKTRIMTSEEFLGVSQFAEENEPTDEEDATTRRFMALRLHYDPYSPSASADYEALREKLDEFDIVSMLTRETGKTRVDQALARRLMAAIQHLEGEIREQAVRTLLENLEVLYPVMAVVLITLKMALPTVSEASRLLAYTRLRDLIRRKSYLLALPVNLTFALRVLSDDPSEETESILADTYLASSSYIVRRDVVLIMTKRNADYWLSDLRRQYGALSPWEKRALVVGSYILEDEGRHWRESIKSQMTPLDKLAAKWAAARKGTGDLLSSL